MDQGTPIAYTGLAVGTPVVNGSGVEFGKVEHVLQIPEEDLFDGIAISTDHGLRFLDRDQVGEISTTRVVCTLSDADIATLPAPSGNPVLHVDDLEDTGKSLHDRVGRLFGRPHWFTDFPNT